MNQPLAPTAPVSPTAPTPAQLEAGFQAARKLIDGTGYGTWVSDENCRKLSLAIVDAAVAAK